MEEENPLMRDFKKWTSENYGIPIESLKKIVYECGDVGLVVDGIGEVMHMNHYFKYLESKSSPNTQ